MEKVARMLTIETENTMGYDSAFVLAHRVKAVLLKDIVSEQPYRPVVSWKRGAEVMVDLETQQAFHNGQSMELSDDEYRVSHAN